MNQNQIKILNIKKLKRPSYYSIEFKLDDDNIEKKTISEDMIVEYFLTKDKIITNEEYLKLIDANEKNNYFMKVCNYISFQMRSEKEVIEYLQKLGAEKEDINKIIIRLKSLEFINDDLLAKALLDSIKNNKKGPKAFTLKLMQRKVSKDITIPIYEKEIEEEVIDSVINKNWDKKSHLPVKKQQEQLYAKLVRDGFSSDLIEKKIKNIKFNDESDLTLEKEVQKQFRKYHLDDDELENRNIKDILNTIINNLRQKGYDYNKIKEIISSLNE